MSLELAQAVMQRIEALGRISDEAGRLTRWYGSPAMGRANDQVGQWMREAGMDVRRDAVGNLIGRYASDRSDAKRLLLGSHLDTVRDAGKFDGPLGVLVAIACVQQLRDRNQRLPYNIEVYGFADEEGLRYQSTYLGSKAVAGTFDDKLLDRKDADGVSLAEAIRTFGGDPQGLAAAKVDPAKTLGYVEVHIEQGPVLEQSDLAVGVVTAICGQTRAAVTFTGRAGHAGTTPMHLRQDALCAAAQWVLEVETLAGKSDGLLATVGAVDARPGASNVIPGQVQLSLDLRHALDDRRVAGASELQQRATAVARGRNVHCDWQTVQQIAAVECDQALSARLSNVVARHQRESPGLPSGAGHDAAAMAEVLPVAMLFVRCREGLSHHPNESVALDDVQVAAAVLGDFLRTTAGAA